MEPTLEEKQRAQLDILEQIEVGEAIARAKIVFGLSGNGQDLKADVETAKLALQEIRFVRKHAKAKDICEAIRLFASGEISFQNQLSVVSVQNINRAYKFYMDEFLHKQAQEVPRIQYFPPSHQLPDATELKNQIARRELFFKYVDDPKAMDGWYLKMFEQLQKIGLCSIDAETWSKRYWDMARKILNPDDTQYPAELWTNRYKRGDMFKFKALMTEGIWPTGPQFANNHFHLFLVKKLKLELISESLKLGKEKLIEIYDLHNQK